MRRGSLSSRSARSAVAVSVAIGGLVLASSLSALARPADDVPACAATLPQSFPSAPAAAVSILVPTGASGVLVCRYRGLNDPAPADVGLLAGSQQVNDPSELASLIQQFDALPPSPYYGPYAIACPVDDGSMLTAEFSYAGGAPDVVRVRPEGCSTATNGTVSSSLAAPLGPQLVTTLDSLTDCVPGRPLIGLCNGDPPPTPIAPPNPTPPTTTTPSAPQSPATTLSTSPASTAPAPEGGPAALRPLLSILHVLRRPQTAAARAFNTNAMLGGRIAHTIVFVPGLTRAIRLPHGVTLYVYVAVGMRTATGQVRPPAAGAGLGTDLEGPGGGGGGCCLSPAQINQVTGPKLIPFTNQVVKPSRVWDYVELVPNRVARVRWTFAKAPTGPNPPPSDQVVVTVPVHDNVAAIALPDRGGPLIDAWCNAAGRAIARRTS